MNLKQQLLQKTTQQVDFKGLLLTLRIAPLDFWIQQGAVPVFFQNKYLQTNGGNPDIPKPSMDEAEKIGRDDLGFREKVVRYCLVNPPIAPAEREPLENELTMEQVQLIPELYDFVYIFGIYRGANALLNTKGGEIKADDLATFRDEQEQPVSDSTHGGEVLGTPILTAGTAG